MYVRLIANRLIDRFRKLFGIFGSETAHPLHVMPVAVVNDDYIDQVRSVQGQRSTVGTTTLITTKSDRTDTYITAFTLALSNLAETI